jgi:hypothetical protein
MRINSLSFQYSAWSSGGSPGYDASASERWEADAMSQHEIERERRQRMIGVLGLGAPEPARPSSSENKIAPGGLPHVAADERSKREQMHEAVQIKLARATIDLALDRLTPRMGVVLANVVLRDQLDRLHDHEHRRRMIGR